MARLDTYDLTLSISHGALCGRVLVVVALALASCGDPAKTDATAPHPDPPVLSLLEQGRAYERGTWGTRDYRAAFGLYRTACDDGRGDLIACRAMLKAALRSRGVGFRQPELLATATRICEASRELFSCAVAAMLEPRRAATSSATAWDVLSHLPTCDAQHLDACEARLLGSGLNVSGGETAERREREPREAMCSAGLIDACAELVRADTSGAHTHALFVAKGQLRSACDSGDADGCAAAPDRLPYPPRALCAAHDYRACAVIGCRGDAAAAKIAADQGVRGDCAALHDDSVWASMIPLAERDVAALEQHRVTACACKDITCADRVLREPAPATSTPATAAAAAAQTALQLRMHQAYNQIAVCLDRLASQP